MEPLRKYTPFFSSALLMWVVLYIIYPHYQYYIDPDGTAYLTISRRYANGDIQRAINGYWSPWSCWLTAGLIRLGLQPIPSSVVINTLGATGFLFISQSFFLRFSLARTMQWLFDLTLVVFLCYAVFWQSFDDLWECFFLLSVLRIMLAARFAERPALWVAIGFIGTLAYFAKAYSFPFFILNTLCCTWLLTGKDWKRSLTISVVAIATMVVCSLPWIWALHSKYGIWTTSTAGTLNMSWYLVGHPVWKEGIDLLLPPPYPDSPYYWEDPWFVNGPTPHFWDSWQLFGLQILRAGYNLFKLLRSMLGLSVFFPILFLLASRLCFSKQFRVHFPSGLRVVALSFLLFPLGYILINYESRYLWYMVPLSMVMGGLVLQNAAFNFRIPRALKVALPLSFLIVPVWRLMVEMYDEGKYEYDFARTLKVTGITGSFTGNERARSMSKVAFFSGLQYFSPIREFRQDTLLKEVRKYGVDYCVYFRTRSEYHIPFSARNFSIYDESGKEFPRIKLADYPQYNIYYLR
ncbi:MAG: hypothetical protein V4649_14975 [Bacteroidota bacterium]